MNLDTTAGKQLKRVKTTFITKRQKTISEGSNSNTSQKSGVSPQSRLFGFSGDNSLSNPNSGKKFAESTNVNLKNEEVIQEDDKEEEEYVIGFSDTAQSNPLQREYSAIEG